MQFSLDNLERLKQETLNLFECLIRNENRLLRWHVMALFSRESFRGIRTQTLAFSSEILMRDQSYSSIKYI